MDDPAMKQGHLFEIMPEQPLPALILSIREMHVDRIFQGSKLYELRKTLPTTRFRRVYLYETGTGKGIVGCFDANRIYDSEPLEKLWDTVGELGTSKERFNAYFDGRETGCAIAIANPVKFREPVIPPVLKNKKPNFSAPMSYLVLGPGERLYTYLEAKRTEEMGHRDIALRLIEPDEYRVFRDMVTREISRNYDEISVKFAESILRTHELGRDPRGIFTVSKEVYSVIAKPNQLIGFTTLTYKIGGSVKTGPTVLLAEYRNKGFGKAIRVAIERICREREARKIYCTCPDNELGVLRYLLNSDMRVEAHLTDHYSASHGELVLGKMMKKGVASYHAPERPHDCPATVCDPADFREGVLAPSVHRLLQSSGYDVDLERATSITKAAMTGGEREYEDKPIRMICLKSRGRCEGFVILIPKRGGSVKGLIASLTSHSRSITFLIEAAEEYLCSNIKRKLYVNHNLGDHAIVELLVSNGYQMEGVLRQPYKAGIDHLILAKMMSG